MGNEIPRGPYGILLPILMEVRVINLNILVKNINYSNIRPSMKIYSAHETSVYISDIKHQYIFSKIFKPRSAKWFQYISDNHFLWYIWYEKYVIDFPICISIQENTYREGFASTIGVDFVSKSSV